MSELKSRPPSKTNKQDLDAFLSGAEKKVSSKVKQQSKAIYPWIASGIRVTLPKSHNLIAGTLFVETEIYCGTYPGQNDKFCLNVLTEAIDKRKLKS